MLAGFFPFLLILCKNSKITHVNLKKIAFQTDFLKIFLIIIYMFIGIFSNKFTYAMALVYTGFCF